MTHEGRRRAVQAGLWVTRGTAYAADYYELRLLVCYIQGELIIEQVCNRLAQRLASLSVAPQD